MEQSNEYKGQIENKCGLANHLPRGKFKIKLDNINKRVFSNEDKRRERSLLVQKKNIKFEKK